MAHKLMNMLPTIEKKFLSVRTLKTCTWQLHGFSRKSRSVPAKFRYGLIHGVFWYQLVCNTSDRCGENFDFVLRSIGKRTGCIIDDLLSLNHGHKFLSASKLLTTDLCYHTRSILRPVDDIALDDTVGRY